MPSDTGFLLIRCVAGYGQASFLESRLEHARDGAFQIKTLLNLRDDVGAGHNTMSTKQPIKLAEAAKRLGISKQAAQHRIDRGHLDAYKDDKGHWWVPWPPDEAFVGDVVEGQLPVPPKRLAVSLSLFGEELAQLSRAMQELQETNKRQQTALEEVARLLRDQQMHQQTELEAVSSLLKDQQTRQPNRDEWIVARMREMMAEKPKRPWWKWWRR